jgi:carboxypeptidase Taq
MAKAAKKKNAKAPVRRVGKRKPAKTRRSPEQMLGDLKARLREIADLYSAEAVLSWDQATYMPPGGASARGRQTALLSRLAHERRIDPEIGQMLDGLAPFAQSLPPDHDDACLIRVTRRRYEKAIKVPADYVARASAHAAASYDAWTRARPANDFAAMVPYLEKTLELSREYSGFFKPYRHIADPHIDDADEGMTTAAIRSLFDELRRELVPLVRAICDQPVADDSCLARVFPKQAQFEFGLKVAREMGYDTARGRLDLTHHPFCTTFALGDVRITTRVNERDLGDALFSTVHEAGHAMYEQGVNEALEGTPLGHGVSAGVHESQARLWNVVARSDGFWQHYYPQLKQVFPDQLGNVPLATFHRAINKVSRSLIRTDADEVTYNLHVMLRFDLETRMLEGKLRVRDLPDAWNAAMQETLGITPPDDRDGCLQDVHWFSGTVGGCFQGYTIGNVLGAQFYAAALKARPDIPSEIARGEFAMLHGWLRENIYRHGSKFPPNGLLRRATGSAMTMQPYLDYLRGKYAALYQLR